MKIFFVFVLFCSSVTTGWRKRGRPGGTRGPLSSRGGPGTRLSRCRRPHPPIRGQPAGTPAPARRPISVSLNPLSFPPRFSRALTSNEKGQRANPPSLSLFASFCFSFFLLASYSFPFLSFVYVLGFNFFFFFLLSREMKAL